MDEIALRATNIFSNGHERSQKSIRAWLYNALHFVSFYGQFCFSAMIVAKGNDALQLALIVHASGQHSNNLASSHRPSSSF